MRALLVLITIIGFGISSFAGGLEGIWYNTDKSAKIEIYKNSKGEYFGKIIWLEDPLNEDGKPKTDIYNPEDKNHSNPIIGLVILKNFELDEDNEYDRGTIYDPENGKTYKCILTLNGDKLDVRGYIGIPAFGRTENWSRAN